MIITSDGWKRMRSERNDDSDRWLIVIDMTIGRRECPHWSNDLHLSIKMEKKKVADRFSRLLFIRSDHFDQSYPKSNQWFLSLISLTDLISMSKTNRSSLFLDNYISIDICQSIVKASSAHSFSITLLTETPEGNWLKCHSLSLSLCQPASFETSRLQACHILISSMMTDENCQERKRSDLCQNSTPSVLDRYIGTVDFNQLTQVNV